MMGIEKTRFVLVRRVKTGNEVISLGNAWGSYFLGLKNGELKKFNTEWNEVDVLKTGGQIKGIATSEDRIFLTSWDKNIYCVSKDMKVLWKKPVDSFPFGIGAGKNFVVYTTNSGTLGALDIEGKTLWEKKFEGTLECVKVSGERIYTGTYKGEAIAMDTSGTPLWTFNCTDIIKSISLGKQFYVYTTATGRVFMFRDDGTMYWVKQEPSPTIGSDVTENRIAVGFFNNSIQFFDKTGKILQRIDEGSKPNAILFRDNSTLIIGTHSANIYQNFPDENVEILYEVMCIGGKCGTFISAELLDTCPQCGSEKIISRVVEERRFTKEFE
ncbi:MAG: PQQ-binding-like beta-propeller repeat protein [Thermoplasmata archaeon]|nr:PQQ-binding-like beta-propeller repeat protein [Thermoplasmata archaeon]